MTGEIVAAVPTSSNGWFCHNTTTGLSGGPALANNTIYNIYMYDNDGVVSMEPSLVAPVADAAAGYMVMPGDPSKLYKGRGQTDGSAQWVSTGAQFLNPLPIPAATPGTFGSFWYSDADRKFRVRTSATAPASLVAGTYEYWPTLETGVTYDPPSIAAGAYTTVDVTVVCGVGDYCSGVAFSSGWGGLVASGTVKAANTVTVYVFNPTGGAIDLPSGSLRVAIQRR